MGSVVKSSEVRVLIYHATPDADGIHRAYDRVSACLAAVPGMLGNELLHSMHDPLGWVVISRWADLAAFDEWEQGAEHKLDTAPLRPYRDTRLSRPFGIFEVTASY